MSGSACAAIMIDLDGTLVDSEPCHFRAHQDFLKSQGIMVDDAMCRDNIGKGDREFYLRLTTGLGRTDADIDAWVAAKTARLVKFYDQGSLSLRLGAEELLAWAFRHGVPCCIVTSAGRELARATLAAVGLGERLPMRVVYEDTVRHKPDPAPYLLAASRLGVPPGACMAIEDSIAGIASAAGAGMFPIAFPGLIAAQDLVGAGARRCIDRLDGAIEAWSGRDAGR